MNDDLSPDDPTEELPATAPASSEGVTFSAREIAERWQAAGAEIAKSLDQELVVAFVGAASAGKDAAIRALFGVDFGEIDPIPGSTDELKAIRLDAEGRAVVINAPGFGDLRAGVEAVSRALVQKVDVAVYLVNADGGASADDRANLESLRTLGRPVLVCVNKMDLIRPEHREVLFNTTLAQLGHPAELAVATAFDPLPALGLAPLGMAEVIGWLHRTLSGEGKGLLFARQLRDRAAASEPIIRSSARAAAVAGAMPVPGADIAAVSAIQVKMISDVAAVHGVRIDRDVALFIMGEALAGASKGFVRWALTALKAGGWIPGGPLGELATSALGASVSGAATYGVGQAAVRYMAKARAGEAVSGDELRQAFDAAAYAWRDKVSQEGAGAPQPEAAPERGPVIDVEPA
jgi:GTP-binding protein Era